MSKNNFNWLLSISAALFITAGIIYSTPVENRAQIVDNQLYLEGINVVSPEEVVFSLSDNTTHTFIYDYLDTEIILVANLIDSTQVLVSLDYASNDSGCISLSPDQLPGSTYVFCHPVGAS